MSSGDVPIPDSCASVIGARATGESMLRRKGRSIAATGAPGLETPFLAEINGPWLVMLHFAGKP